MATSTTYPWSVLGIAPTADRVAIKRAYAGRLKLTRPEDDADGFEELFQAREAALAWARSGPVAKGPAPVPHEPVQGNRVAKARPSEPTLAETDAIWEAIAPKLRQMHEATLASEAGGPSPQSLTTDALPSAQEPEADLAKQLAEALDSTLFKDVTQAEALLLERLRDLPLQSRGNWERKLLAVVLDRAAKLANGPAKAQGGWATRDAKVKLLQALGQEFNWLEEDKRLNAYADDIESDSFDIVMKLIRPKATVANKPKMVKKTKQSNWGRVWLWCFVIYVIIKMLALAAGS